MVRTRRELPAAKRSDGRLVQVGIHRTHHANIADGTRRQHDAFEKDLALHFPDLPCVSRVEGFDLLPDCGGRRRPPALPGSS